MKICSKCNQGKTVFEFRLSKLGRRFPWCRPCEKTYKAQWEAKNREQTNERKAQWKRDNPEKTRAQRKSYQSTYRINKPQIHRAHASVAKALKSGRLLRINFCQDCGKPGTQSHHHAGYDKANYLNVRWLCPKCHAKADKQQRKDQTLCHTS